MRVSWIFHQGTVQSWQDLIVTQERPRKCTLEICMDIFKQLYNHNDLLLRNDGITRLPILWLFVSKINFKRLLTLCICCCCCLPLCFAIFGWFPVVRQCDCCRGCHGYHLPVASFVLWQLSIHSSIHHWQIQRTTYFQSRSITRPIFIKVFQNTIFNQDIVINFESSALCVHGAWSK